MVTCKNLGHGRMGNMMFAIAATIGYARKHNMEYFIPRWKYSDAFEGPFQETQILPPTNPYQEPRFAYDEIPYMENIDLVGYYQSVKYFEHCEDEIRSLFTFKSEIIEKVEKFINQNSNNKTKISIHYRRTDYVTTMAHFFHNLTIDWYKQAMSRFDNCHFFITSDDIPQARIDFNFTDNITFSEGDEIFDMCLISQCDHNIICNSSFSFWGSYLNNNPNKRIIAPKDWFQPIANHDTSDLYLPSWQLI